ncbi:hypothetical protein K1719_029948 [Acacia pycnantha]|nr:hypothetical protein K1719_029948 [Acacia pycnantha]
MVDVDAIDSEISVIDLSLGNEQRFSQVGNAYEDWVFFQVINHDMPIELHKKIEICSKKFDQSLDNVPTFLRFTDLP